MSRKTERLNNIISNLSNTLSELKREMADAHTRITLLGMLEDEKRTTLFEKYAAEEYLTFLEGLATDQVLVDDQVLLEELPTDQVLVDDQVLVEDTAILNTYKQHLENKYKEQFTNPKSIDIFISFLNNTLRVLKSDKVKNPRVLGLAQQEKEIKRKIKDLEITLENLNKKLENAPSRQEALQAELSENFSYYEKIASQYIETIEEAFNNLTSPSIQELEPLQKRLAALEIPDTLKEKRQNLSQKVDKAIALETLKPKASKRDQKEIDDLIATISSSNPYNVKLVLEDIEGFFLRQKLKEEGYKTDVVPAYSEDSIKSMKNARQKLREARDAAGTKLSYTMVSELLESLKVSFNRLSGRSEVQKIDALLKTIDNRIKQKSLSDKQETLRTLNSKLRQAKEALRTLNPEKKISQLRSPEWEEEMINELKSEYQNRGELSTKESNEIIEKKQKQHIGPIIWEKLEEVERLTQASNTLNALILLEQLHEKANKYDKARIDFQLSILRKPKVNEYELNRSQTLILRMELKQEGYDLYKVFSNEFRYISSKMEDMEKAQTKVQEVKKAVEAELLSVGGPKILRPLKRFYKKLFWGRETRKINTMLYKIAEEIDNKRKNPSERKLFGEATTIDNNAMVEGVSNEQRNERTSSIARSNSNTTHYSSDSEESLRSSWERLGSFYEIDNTSSALSIAGNDSYETQSSGATEESLLKPFSSNGKNVIDTNVFKNPQNAPSLPPGMRKSRTLRSASPPPGMGKSRNSQRP